MVNAVSRTLNSVAHPHPTTPHTHTPPPPPHTHTPTHTHTQFPDFGDFQLGFELVPRKKRIYRLYVNTDSLHGLRYGLYFRRSFNSVRTVEVIFNFFRRGQLFLDFTSLTHPHTPTPAHRETHLTLSSSSSLISPPSGPSKNKNTKRIRLTSPDSETPHTHQQ